MRSAGVLLVGVLLGTLTTTGACTESRTIDPPPASASPPAPPDPVDLLVGAITKTRVTTVRFTIDVALGGVAMLHGTGAIDPANNSQSSTLTATGDGSTTHEQTVTIGADLYVKQDDRKNWWHVDAKRLAVMPGPGGGDLRDPTALASYEQVVATAHSTGTGRYEGTLDYAKLIKEAVGDPDAQVAKSPFSAVPFIATVDGQGRLTSIATTMPAAAGVPAITKTVRFSDFGAPVTIETPPAGQTEDAPTDLFPPIGG